MSAGAAGDEIVWTARLGSHLEASRKRAGMRRRDLATRVEVSEETIRLWERGVVQPSPDRLARLIAVLSIETSLWQLDDATEPDELPVLALRLRDERQALGLTQAAVASTLGIPQATYAGWETGRTSPGDGYIKLLAGFLGCTEAEVANLGAAPFNVDYSGWPALGRVVGARRQALRLSRADLAEALGVSIRVVMSWELGYRNPQPPQLTSLARVLSIPMATLAEAIPQRVTPSQLGELILRRQRELGLRSADVARLVGTTESTLSRWVNGHSRPIARNLQRLAEVLGLSPSQLNDVTGSPA